MLTEESKRRLYAQARDEAERQRLWLPSGLTPRVMAFSSCQPLRVDGGGGLFGPRRRLCRLCVLPASVTHTKAFLAAVLLAFLLSLIAINMSLDGERGAGRKAWLELTSRRYGYPIVLAAGLYLGGLYHGHAERAFEVGLAQHAMVMVCAQRPGCVAEANSAFGGEVTDYVKR